jgi:hypothetical protein
MAKVYNELYSKASGYHLSITYFKTFIQFILVSSIVRLKSKPYCEMKPPRAFPRLSIQFVAVINPDGSDGRKIVQPCSD